MAAGLYVGATQARPSLLVAAPTTRSAQHAHTHLEVLADAVVHADRAGLMIGVSGS